MIRHYYYLILVFLSLLNKLFDLLVDLLLLLNFNGDVLLLTLCKAGDALTEGALITGEDLTVGNTLAEGALDTEELAVSESNSTDVSESFFFLL